MHVLKTGLIVILVLFALLIVVGTSLESELTIVRDVTIEAAPAEVFPLLNDLRRWPDWTVWTEHPGIERTFGDRWVGEGAEVDWTFQDGNRGHLEITSSTPMREVEYTMTVSSSKISNSGRIALELEGGQTRVSWTDTGDVGFVGVFFRGRIENELAGDLERALTRLKEQVEAGK